MKITSIENWKTVNTQDTIFKNDFLSLDQAEIEKRLSETLDFGTAGIRGIMGFGTNRMNEFTVAAAAQAYAQFLLKQNKANAQKGVIVAHDNRHNNVLFSEVASRVLMANGIKVYLFEGNKLQSTPFTSYVIRQMKLAGGVIITASHNPKEYNGFKVYNEHGGQLMPEFTQQVQNFMKDIDPLTVKRFEGQLNYLDSTLHNEYLDDLSKIIINPSLNLNIKVGYSAQHGTGISTAPQLFKKINVFYDLVDSQMTPDPDFSNTKTPNPESKDSFDELVKLGKEKGLELLLTTDPDADRLAIAVLHKGKYEFFDGNQTAALYLDFKLKNIDPRKVNVMNCYIVKSVVSGELPAAIAKANQVMVYETHVGFKNIASIIDTLSNKDYMFGYEESYGTLLNQNMARDKDSFQMMVGLVELASNLKHHGKTLVDYYEEIETKHGKHQSGNTSKVMTPDEQKIKLEVMSTLNWPDIQIIEDYRNGYNGLDKQNLVKVKMNDGSWFALRPSGTEPKVKIYAEAINNPKFLKRVSDFIEG